MSPGFVPALPEQKEGDDGQQRSNERNFCIYGQGELFIKGVQFSDLFFISVILSICLDK